MGKQFCLKLLIVSSVLGQGTVVSSEENIDSLSVLLIRQKRASSTGSNSPEYYQPHIPEPHQPHVPEHHQPHVPEHHQPQLRPRWVHVVSGENRLGEGVVVHPRVIATRASFFLAGEEYQVMFAKPDGDYERLHLHPILRHPKYVELHEGPGGIHDVALAVASGEMPNDDYVINDLSALKYKPNQGMWIFQTLPSMIRNLH